MGDSMSEIATPPPSQFAAASFHVPERIAAHRLSLQGDLLHVEVMGNLDREVIEEILAVYQRCIDHFGYLLVLMSVQHSTGMDQQARRRAVEWGQDHPTVQSAAVYGAPLAVRAMMSLLHRATQLLSKQDAAHMTFVATEAEGRQWLEAQRARLAAAAQAKRAARSTS